MGNAFVSYARYLGKTVWPDALSPLYFHPGHWPAITVVGALALLLVLTVIAWRQRTERPWVTFGWLWFVLTLVPVIGLVQVGAQAMADRYTYVPLLGIFTGAVRLAAAGVERWPWVRVTVIAASAVALLGAGAITHRQAGVWHDNVRLYRHSISVGEDNPAVRYLLGMELLGSGRPEAEAIAEFRRAIELRPDYVNAHTQLAAIALQHRQIDEARRILEQNIRFEPDNAGLHYNLGVLSQIQGRGDEASRHFQDALRLDPRRSDARREIAQGYARANRLEEARAEYEIIARTDPWNAGMLAEYGVLLANMGGIEEGCRELARAVWIDPDNAAARQNLAVVEQLLSRQR